MLLIDPLVCGWMLQYLPELLRCAAVLPCQTGAPNHSMLLLAPPNLGLQVRPHGAGQRVVRGRLHMRGRHH